MLSFLKVALRGYRRYGTYTLLNGLGLAVGYAAAGLIGMYLFVETSYEHMHQQADHIYRLTYHTHSSAGYETHWARVPVDYINEIPAVFPEVEQLIRFQNHERKYLRIDGDSFFPEHAYQADSGVFSVFDFSLRSGDPNRALAEPNSLVLTTSLARQYFGETNPMGQTVEVIGEYTDEPVAYRVTGVMADIDPQTHLPVQVLLSMPSPEARTWWAYVYLRLTEGTDVEALAQKLEAFAKDHQQEGSQVQESFPLQQLPSIHLDSQLAREIVPNGQLTYLGVFVGVGAFMLLIALINYINLASAMVLGRTRAQGVRLVLGAQRSRLFAYGCAEAVLFHLVAAAGAWGLISLTSAPFADLMQVSWLHQPWQLGLFLLGLAVIGGGLSGLYPAHLLTQGHITEMIRQGKSFSLRRQAQVAPVNRWLMGLQFAVSVLLMASAWAMQEQLSYLEEKSLGLNPSQVLSMAALPNPVTDDFPLFRSRAEQIPGVEGVSACLEVPSRAIQDGGPVMVVGRDQDINQAPVMDIQVISPGYLDVLGIELVGGEDRTDQYRFQGPPAFSDSYSPEQYLREQTRQYLINETAMRQLGWQTPAEAIGQQLNLSIGGYQLATGPVTGVVRDYHQESLKQQVDPTIMTVESIWLKTFLLKLSAPKIPETLDALEALWQDMFPAYPMRFEFLDALFNQLYQQERRQWKLLMFTSALAMFIAILGLISLMAYALRTRNRELAIRRLLGAGPMSLIQLIGKEYVSVLLIASATAIPLSYWSMHQWLSAFPYQTNVSWLAYGYPCLIMLGALWVIVSWQVWRNRKHAPATALRDG